MTRRPSRKPEYLRILREIAPKWLKCCKKCKGIKYDTTKCYHGKSYIYCPKWKKQCKIGRGRVRI